jgi:hypothetical protein
MKNFLEYSTALSLLEKVSAQDFKTAEKDTNIRIGIEFEIAKCDLIETNTFKIDVIQSDFDILVFQLVEYGNNLVSARNDWVSDMGSMLDNAIADVKDKLNSDSITNYERVELEAELREFDFMDPYDYGESVNSDVIEYFDTVSYDVSYGEYVDYVEYLGGFFPEDQEFISMVYEITDYGVTNIKDGDVYESTLFLDLPVVIDNYYNEDFVIDKTGSAWKDLVKITGREPRIEINSSDVDYTVWTITRDESLEAGGVEIVSSILTLKDGLDALMKMYKWIDLYGDTGNEYNTGLHINMSFDGYDMSKFDWLKLILFIEEGAIYKDFNRKDNRYAKPVKDFIIDLDGKWDGVSSNEYFQTLKVDGPGGENKVKDMIRGGKFFGVNFTNDDRIEFRYLGGAYHKKLKQTRDSILRYAAWMRLALDPQYKRNDYIKKLIKLISLEAKNVTDRSIIDDGTNIGNRSEGFSGDKPLWYVVEKDGKFIYTVTPAFKIIKTEKLRFMLNDFRFKYHILLNGVNIKNIMNGNPVNDERRKNQFLIALRAFKETDKSKKGLVKFVLSYY